MAYGNRNKVHIQKYIFLERQIRSRRFINTQTLIKWSIFNFLNTEYDHLSWPELILSKFQLLRISVWCSVPFTFTNSFLTIRTISNTYAIHYSGIIQHVYHNAVTLEHESSRVFKCLHLHKTLERLKLELFDVSNNVTRVSH